MIDQICITDAFLEGAKEVFETMIFMDIEKSSEPEQEIEGNTLLGSITFKGDIEGNLVGCLTICCGTACAKIIALNMLGMEPADELSEEEVRDAIGEVTNMVMGSVKTRLQDSVGDLQVSIPTVISGRWLENSLGEKASKVSIKVNIEDEYPAELSLLYRGTFK